MFSEQISRKKNDLKSNLRRQWLGSYFSSKRTQNVNLIQNKNSQIIQLISNLPFSYEDLRKRLQSQFQQTCATILRYIKLLQDKISNDMKMSVNNWTTYCFLASRIFLYISSTHQQLQLHSIYEMLLQIGIAHLDSNKIIQKNIRKTIIQLTLSIRHLIIKISIVELCLLSNIIKEFILQIDFNLNTLNNYEIKQVTTLLNNFLAMQYQQDKQNIDSKIINQLTFKKYKLICEIFLQNNRVLKKIIQGILHTQQQELLQLLLKLLVNATYISSNTLSQIMNQMMIFTVLNRVLSSSQDSYIVTLSVRLIHNLINEYSYPIAKSAKQEQILKILLLTKRQTFYCCKQEIYELFGAFLNVYCKDQDIINYLSQLGLIAMMFDYLQHIQIATHQQTAEFILQGLAKIAQFQFYSLQRPAILSLQLLQSLQKYQNQKISKYVQIILIKLSQIHPEIQKQS